MCRNAQMKGDFVKSDSMFAKAGFYSESIEYLAYSDKINSYLTNGCTEDDTQQRMRCTMRILMIFIDGFGIGPDDPTVNPIVAAHTPVLDRLLGGVECIMIPTDATQGVKGLPQSASGQTALLTGIQASQVLGKHASGFPGPTLRKILAEHNIFRQFTARGKKATFANAYTQSYLDEVRAGTMRASVTTVSVMTAELPFRYLEQILEGQAVYQEYSNQSLVEYGFDLPILTPEEAGHILVNIAKEHDFTLYEYFQSDLAGHSQKMDVAVPLLENLDRLLGQVLAETDLTRTLVIICSDHGNIEDLSVSTHTTNPVPTILIGCGKERIAGKIKELADITPALLALIEDESVTLFDSPQNANDRN